MDSERTQKSAKERFSHYSDQMSVGMRHTPVRPVEAMLFDRVEISGEKPDNSANYDWLTASIAKMSDESVNRKMKKLRDSHPTIEDALAEKIIMEVI